MPKIFALRSRLLEVQNSLLCNPGTHGGDVGKGDDESHTHHTEAHKAHVGRRGPWDVGRGTAWDEDWGSSLLVGDPAAAVEVPEPKVVAEEEEEEKDEDDTGKIDSWSGLRNTFKCCMLCGKM